MNRSYDDADLRLLHALQIAPRAAWKHLAGVLDANPATLARRWNRISDNGDAWITAYPSILRAGGSAFIEIDCEPSAVLDVGKLVARSRLVMSVEELSSGPSLLVTVRAKSVSDLAAYNDAVRAIPGVRDVRTHVITRTFVNASRWRLDALSAEQRRAVEELSPPPTLEPMRALDPLDKALMTALTLDGRTSAAELARKFDVGINTVRRRVQRMVDGGEMELRCDVTRWLAGYDAMVALWIRVHPRDLVASATALLSVPGLRLVASTTGTYNLYVATWLRQTSELLDFEERLVAAAPAVEIGARAFSLRTLKHVGRIMDDSGRAIEVIPMDLWGNADDNG